MAFPELALVPWNTTTNEAQPGEPYSNEVAKGGRAEEMEWRLLSFNGKNSTTSST